VILTRREFAMSDKAERWLAEHEIALLETIFELKSPPDREDRREVIRLKALKVRAPKPPTNRSPSNGSITG
jgi:hypothetical protein